MVFSKNIDVMPVAPTLPISSLSTRMQMPVFSRSLALKLRDQLGKAHTRSSWP